MTRIRLFAAFAPAAMGAAMLFAGSAGGQVNIPPVFPELPPGAQVPPEVAQDLQEKMYHISSIAPGVFWITDGNYHSLAIEHLTGIVLIDAPQPLPFFPAMPVLTALAEVTDKPITHFIYSHAHTDHNGGAGEIRAAYPRAVFIGHEETAAHLTAANDPRRPVPTITFSDNLPLNVGGTPIRLSYHGNSHQEGNIFIHLPVQRVLMVVDVIYPGWVPFRRLALSTDVQGWYEAHETVLSFDFDILVGGHLTRLGNRADAELGLEYVNDIRAAIEEVYTDANALFGAVGAINGVHDPDNAFGGFFAFQPVAKWALFSAFYDLSVQHCTDVLDAKYRSDMGPDPSRHLGGAETFNASNCEAWFVARRVGTDN